MSESKHMTSVTPVDALLVVDVGNTRIGLGIWDSDGLHDVQRLAIEHADSWQPAIAQVWAQTSGTQRAAVIGSVNPSAAARIEALIEEATGQSAHCVRDDLPLPMKLAIDNPQEIGVDRVCSAAAAFERIQDACAIASFGSALTVDCVSNDGRFLGGAILPGLQMSCDALHTHTARLPHITPTRPETIFGQNTNEAIVNGVVYGALGAVRELVERYATELREWPHLVITGGNAPLLAELADYVDAVVPDLCLMGVSLAYRQAAGQP
jgi:type III pantothenate kinase